MIRNFVAGGCSFTYGNELSDDRGGYKTPSQKTWAHGLFRHSQPQGNFINAARPGTGNSGIARRVFSAVSQNNEVDAVVVMWSFASRYDWAMPRHKNLEDTRWATISPWDTQMSNEERHKTLSGSEIQQEEWKRRTELLIHTGVKPFAEAIYKYGANEYHEIYQSWKSIIWLQNILEKKQIPFLFTLADNSLFYNEMKNHKEQDKFMECLYDEIDFTKWFSFGERMMGFNQWALLNDYERGTTHPLDKAHADAIILMKPKLDRIIGGQK